MPARALDRYVEAVSVSTSGILPKCGHPVPADRDRFLAYFVGRSTYCPQGCPQPVELWVAVRGHYMGPGRTFSTLGPLGGQMLLETLALRTNEPQLIDVANYGVPVDSIVRYWNVTPSVQSARHMPQVFYNQGNSPRTAKLGTVVSLLLRTIDLDPGEVEVNVMVDFITPQVSVERAILLGAVLSHAEDDYRRAVIDAHTAADTAVSNALDARTAGVIKATENIGFLRRLAVIEALRREHHLPEFPDNFRQGIKKLNADRNSVAHPRPKKEAFDEQAAAEALTTATFAVNWAEAMFGLPSRASDSRVGM